METGHGPKPEFYQHEEVGSVEAEGEKKARQEEEGLQMAVRRRKLRRKVRRSLVGKYNSQASEPGEDNT